MIPYYAEMDSLFTANCRSSSPLPLSVQQSDWPPRNQPPAKKTIFGGCEMLIDKSTSSPSATHKEEQKLLLPHLPFLFLSLPLPVCDKPAATVEHWRGADGGSMWSIVDAWPDSSGHPSDHPQRAAVSERGGVVGRNKSLSRAPKTSCPFLSPLDRCCLPLDINCRQLFNGHNPQTVAVLPLLLLLLSYVALECECECVFIANSHFNWINNQESTISSATPIRCEGVVEDMKFICKLFQRLLAQRLLWRLVDDSIEGIEEMKLRSKTGE